MRTKSKKKWWISARKYSYKILKKRHLYYLFQYKVKSIGFNFVETY